jgi:hypothetical protein
MRVEADTPFGKQSIEVRFAIRNAAGAYFTEMAISGTRDVMMNGAVIGQETQYLPQFAVSTSRFASQFDTQRDAEAVMSTPQFGGPQSFEGCVVVPSEQ